MRSSILCFLFSVFCVGSAWACEPVPEKISNIIKQNNELILVGEMHGTLESPHYFYEIVCNAISLSRKQVVAAIELFEGDVTLDGDNKHLASAVNRSDVWRKNHDGKTSEAMFELLERFNLLVKDGKLKVIFFDKDDEARDLSMAMTLKEHLSGDSLVIALTGNRHNKIKHGNSWDPNSKNMGAYLKEMDVNLSSINLLTNGGNAWVCMPNCANHELSTRNLEGYEEVFDASDKSGYQFHWLVGAVHASEPKVR